MPGADSGTRNMVRPLCLGRSGSVRVIRKTYWHCWAPVVQILGPLMTHSSPSRTARTLAFAMSEPPSGSEYSRQKRTWPDATLGRTSASTSGSRYFSTALHTSLVVEYVIHGTLALASWTSRIFE